MSTSKFKVGETVRVTKHANFRHFLSLKQSDSLRGMWGKIESADLRGKQWHYEIDFGEELGVHTLSIGCIDRRSKPADYGGRSK